MKASVGILLSAFVALTTVQARAEDNKTNTKVDAAATGAAQPATAVNPDSNYIMCRNGKEVRTIRVEKKGNSYFAIYTKDGVDHPAGKSMTADKVQKIIQNIEARLEYGEWKCKDISQARVSSSAD